MKLFRFGPRGSEKPGIQVREKHYDISPFIGDYHEEFFSANGIEKLNKIVQEHLHELVEIPGAFRFAPVIHKPGKIICIGLNFRDHAIETNSPIPVEPIVFFKATTAVCGPNDDLILPRNHTKADWEVELAVVIGKKASYVEEAAAYECIAGYTLHNDYSERAFQLERGGQWVKGKSCDTFAPIGPYLVTPDEIPDVNNLGMWLNVNGQTMQDSNTAQMIFKVPFLIHYLSQFMTLMPGDIISTGTPPGVGMGFKPPVFLKKGDFVELGIEGLGSSSQNVTE